jgi:Flp pilus assembly protein TadD
VRDRDADLATLRSVLQAAQAGRLSEAAELASAALADGLEHPLLLNAAAISLEQEGRYLEAEALLQRAVQIAPADIAARNALGLCLLQLDKPAAALLEFGTILQINSSLPYAHASHGNALLALGQITEAESSYRRALEIDPNQVSAMAGLAHIASRRGAYPAGRMWAKKALDLVPGLPGAVMSLAISDLGLGDKKEAEAGVSALLQDSRLGPMERAYADGVLGDVLDAQGRRAEAFAAYCRCNEELQRIYAPRFAEGPTALEYVRSMVGFFEAVKSQKPGAPPVSRASPVRGHVFLLGFPRSGTTLLEVILEGHPDVVSLEENESLIDAVQEFMRQPEDLRGLFRAPAATLEALRGAYWQRVEEAGMTVAGKVFVDKNPLNTLKLPLINRLFPNAKILFACRDPRDIVLSCFRHRFKMSAPIYELLSLEGAARYYDAVMQVLLLMNSALSLNPCLIRHEDLVRDFTGEMKRICGYLDLVWAPGMGDFAQRTKDRDVVTPSTAQLVRGLNTEGVGQWRRYRDQLAPVLPLLEPWVKRFYYDP